MFWLKTENTSAFHCSKEYINADLLPRAEHPAQLPVGRESGSYLGEGNIAKLSPKIPTDNG